MRALRLAAAEDLTRRFGKGHWSLVPTKRTMKKYVTQGTLWVGEVNAHLIATFRFGDKKVPFYRQAWFEDPSAAAGYLRGMAVAPENQRRGFGRVCMARIEEIARDHGLSYIRLDSYDSPAGAGGFYEKCGYSCVHSGEINGVPLKYWEKRVSGSDSGAGPRTT